MLMMPGWNRLQRWMRAGVAVMVVLVMMVCCGLLTGVAPAAALPQGNAIKDPKALLRNALPIDNKTARDLQNTLEDISAQLRAARRWGSVNSDLSRANFILTTKQDKLLATIPPERQAAATALIEQIKTDIEQLRTTADARDRTATLEQRQQVLDRVGKLEALMVPGFPYEVPAEYSSLPQLKGRATIALKTTQGDMTAVVDGYSAPVTAGNFVDLVQRGFYNNMPFNRAEDFYILQTGDPEGPEVGFVDPKTNQYRAIPLEVLAQGDREPTYGITLEDAGRPLDQPVLPFSAYGAMALARPNDDPNGGSSQFFFFLFEPELTPAGSNLLDGRYAIFGYVIEGAEVLGKLKAEDKIISAQVVDGLENLV
jgi:peptidylprolyl isomerase